MAVPTDEQRGRPTAGGSVPPVPDVVAATEVPVSPVVVGSLREYLGTQWQRIRSGQSGMLPIVLGLILIVVVFQVLTSKYLTAGDIVNILAYGSIFVTFGLAETFALVLSEIDLSISYVGFVGAMIMAELLNRPFDWPWWAAIVVALLACGAIGLVQGALITRLRIPSFVVTLAGLLGWQGFLIFITGADKTAVGGVLSISENRIVWGIVNAQMSPVAGWIVYAAVIAAFAAYVWSRDGRRRASGLSAPPRSITAATIVGVAALGALLVWVCGFNRGSSIVVLEGVPYFVPVLIAVIVLLTVLFHRTRFGRYLYAIGANPEAARRAGIRVAAIRTLAFMLCSFTAGIAGVIYASRQGSMSISVTGGVYTLLGVAAAVIGGTSLFGGRGKPVYAVIGGVIVAAIYYGLFLLGVSADGTYMAIAVVLVAAATVDTLARRRRPSAT